MNGIEVSIDGFTGPLDLLCYLVESRKFQASKIKVAQLVRIYGAYLSKTQNASTEVISEFFFMAASLLLQKVLSLLPSGKEFDAIGASDESYDGVISEEELLARMSRFSPYRGATTRLLEYKDKQGRRFKRISLQAADALDENRTPVYALGDLYSLSKIWWNLYLEAKSAKNESGNEFLDEDEYWDGVPGALPEEARIQTRIDEITERLRATPTLLLSSLISVHSVSSVVVTLLALLEMCRMEKISVFQEELFGEIRIDAAFGDCVTY
ncbi:MAG: hypothetical protein FWH52_04635 [Synergistaceae bacterium]|nr:hypothetical protein [Synergistaceae bacterium]